MAGALWTRARFFVFFYTPPTAEASGSTRQPLATATPVGSGTVARTARIPIEQRAEAATIAWLRHQTTAYDNLQIPREKGRRREVRRMLARQSVALLEKYRKGQSFDPAQCVLQKAVAPFVPTRTIG